MRRLQIILKNHIIFIIFALFLGALAGIAVWIFCALMNLGIDFLWEKIPNAFYNPWYYPLIVCMIGGIMIGLCQKKFGEYPETLAAVMTKVNREHRINYDNILVVFIAALLPLLFGGSLGPEAGITGAIAGLCTWIGDRFKYAARDAKELAQIGTAATLSVVFGAAPLFGLLSPLEYGDPKEENVVSKTSKIVVYFAAIFGALLSFSFLGFLFPISQGFPRFPSAQMIGSLEWIWFLPLALIGVAAGLFYFLANRWVTGFFKYFKASPVLKAIIGGILLGISGIFLPYTMFSGEHQMGEIMHSWQQVGVVILLFTGIIKLVIGNVCIESGWRGGNIFPIIFSGVSLGYAMCCFIPVDPIFAVVVVTSALCGVVMRKPLLVILVLLICFPFDGLVYMSAATIIGVVIPIPSCFQKKEKKEEA